MSPFHQRSWTPWQVMRWSLFGLGILLIGWMLYRNQSTLILLGISFCVAYLLDPTVDRLERLGLSRSLAIVLIGLGILLGLGIVVLVVVPQVLVQAQLVINRFPAWWWWISAHIDPLLDHLPPPIADYVPTAFDEAYLQEYLTRLWDWAGVDVPKLTQRLLSIVQSMFTGIANFIVGVLNIVLVPVLSFYLLRDYDALRRQFYAAVPPHWHTEIAAWLEDFDRVLGGFLRGQCTIALILALVYAIGLTLIGLPMGFVIGVISGLANMVPYMSIVVGLLPALLLFSLSDAPTWGRLLTLLLVYASGQLLEGLVLSPRIMGKETGLHPVIVMMAILMGGTLFGLGGIILAVPVAAIVQVLVKRWHHAWKATWAAREF